MSCPHSTIDGASENCARRTGEILSQGFKKSHVCPYCGQSWFCVASWCSQADDEVFAPVDFNNCWSAHTLMSPPCRAAYLMEKGRP